jgi:hypothetical protein
MCMWQTATYNLTNEHKSSMQEDLGMATNQQNICLFITNATIW